MAKATPKYWDEYSEKLADTGEIAKIVGLAIPIDPRSLTRRTWPLNYLLWRKTDGNRSR